MKILKFLVNQPSFRPSNIRPANLASENPWLRKRKPISYKGFHLFYSIGITSPIPFRICNKVFMLERRFFTAENKIFSYLNAGKCRIFLIKSHIGCIRIEIVMIIQILYSVSNGLGPLIEPNSWKFQNFSFEGKSQK